MLANRSPISIFGLFIIFTFLVSCTDENNPQGGTIHIDLESGDMSGRWEIRNTADPSKIVSFTVGSTKQSVTSDLETFEYYPYEPQGIIFSGFGDDKHHLGLYVVKHPDNGRHYVIWVRLRKADLPAEGHNVDKESSMILEQDGTTLILGGDFEETELNRLIKVGN